MKKEKLLILLIPVISIWSGNASAATWCGATNILDVICYSNGQCYVTADSYGGDRYYQIASDDMNKNAMLSIALSVFASKGKARLVFHPDSLDCTNVAQDTMIYGIGATGLN